MSVDESREVIENVARERGNSYPGYRDDLNPTFPKFVARCGCGWSASTFDEDETRVVRSVAESHEYGSSQFAGCDGEMEYARVTTDGDEEVWR